MSRIGKLPIIIPSGVKVAIQGSYIKVEGPKGLLTRNINPDIIAKLEGDKILITVSQNVEGSLYGLTRTLIYNMVSGVNKGFEKSLEINGMGYKAEVKGKNIILNLGYSHPINFTLPEGINANVEKQTKLTIMGADKELVGQVAADLRALRVPDVYKAKGVKYVGEVIKKKAGKSVVGAQAGKPK